MVNRAPRMTLAIPLALKASNSLQALAQIQVLATTMDKVSRLRPQVNLRVSNNHLGMVRLKAPVMAMDKVSKHRLQASPRVSLIIPEVHQLAQESRSQTLGIRSSAPFTALFTT